MLFNEDATSDVAMAAKGCAGSLLRLASPVTASLCWQTEFFILPFVILYYVSLMLQT
jgi:hypothetical protein